MSCFKGVYIDTQSERYKHDTSWSRHDPPSIRGCVFLYQLRVCIDLKTLMFERIRHVWGHIVDDFPRVSRSGHTKRHGEIVTEGFLNVGKKWEDEMSGTDYWLVYDAYKVLGNLHMISHSFQTHPKNIPPLQTYPPKEMLLNHPEVPNFQIWADHEFEGSSNCLQL